MVNGSSGMASSLLALSLITGATAVTSSLSFLSDRPSLYPTSSGGESSLTDPTISATLSSELGMTSHVPTLGAFSNPSSFSTPGETTLLFPTSTNVNSIFPSSTSTAGTESPSPSTVRSSITSSSYNSALLSQPTANGYSTMSQLLSPTISTSPTTTLLTSSPSPSFSPIPPMEPPSHEGMSIIPIAAGASGGALLLCICLVIILCGCITCKTGCKTRKWKRMLIRNRRNTEYMHKDAFWAGARAGPKEPPMQDQNALHRNGTIKDVEAPGRHLSPVWSPGHGGGGTEGVDGGNNHQMQDGGGEGNQSDWTHEPSHLRETETTFINECGPPSHATFTIGSHHNQITHAPQSCSPPQVPVVMPTEVPVEVGERADPVSYVNVQLKSGKGVQRSSSEPQRKMDIKKKPIPIPRPMGSPKEAVGYVNVGQPHSAQHPQTLPRQGSGYTPVLVHDGQAPVHVLKESCYDVPRSSVVPFAETGPQPQGAFFPAQAYKAEVEDGFHTLGAAQPDPSHYDIPSGHPTKKAGKVPPFVAPKPQTSGSHNDLYDCPKSTPVQVFPAAVLAGSPPFAGQYPGNDIRGGSCDTSLYDSPRAHSHLLMQRDGANSLYDAPKPHSPTVQYRNVPSPSAVRPRQESQYDVPHSPFQPRNGSGNPDMTVAYDTLAQYPPPAGGPAQFQSQQHSSFTPPGQRQSTFAGNQPTMFQLPPPVSMVPMHPSNHNPSDTSHYDVPRSPHRL